MRRKLSYLLPVLLGIALAKVCLADIAQGPECGIRVIQEARAASRAMTQPAILSSFRKTTRIARLLVLNISRLMPRINAASACVLK